MLTATIAARVPAMWASASTVFAGIDDTSNTRKLQIIAGGLAALGVFLLLFTVWFWRSSRADHSALGPLEVMGARRWRRAPMNEQINRLSEVRPAGASALAGTDRPPVDLAALVAGHRSSTPDRRGGGFSDLVEGEPQSLVASVEEHWDGDLGILDAETESPDPVDASSVEASPAGDAETYEPDHSQRPSAEEIARIEAAVSPPPGPPATLSDEAVSSDEAVPSGQGVSFEEAVPVGEGVQSEKGVPSEEGVPSEVDGSDSAVEPSERIADTADSAPQSPLEEAGDAHDHVDVSGGVSHDAALTPAGVEHDVAEPDSGPEVDSQLDAEHVGVPEAGDDGVPTPSGAAAIFSAHEAADASAPVDEQSSRGSATERFEDAHPHDAGDALAEALAASESDDDEFDPSKELAFERPEPTSTDSVKASTPDAVKSSRWRRWRR